MYNKLYNFMRILINKSNINHPRPLILIIILTILLIISCQQKTGESPENSRININIDEYFVPEDVKTIQGKLYNSNDGNCEVSGKGMYFFIDDALVGFIVAGHHRKIRITPGKHTFGVKMELNKDYKTTDTFDFFEDNWHYWAGCKDGNRP